MSFELESLEETAFNAVYHDLLNSLIDFLQSGSEANVDVEITGVVEGSDALKEEAVHEEPEENLSNKTKLENLEVVSKPIKQIREKLVNSKREVFDEYLIGNYSHYRQKLIGKFSSEGIYQEVKGLWLLFLDCVLDKSFTELDISHFIVVSDPVNVFKIVGNRCSLLDSLELDYGNHQELGEIPPLQMTREIESGICQMLSNMNNLTTLNLSCACQPDDLSLAFFKSLGSSCPQLTHLELEHFPFGIRQLFALMFGSKDALIPQFFKTQPRGSVGQIHRFQFTPESLTPICSSLKTFKNKRPSVIDDDDEEEEEEEEGLCILGNTSTLAFILRHFLKLVKFEQMCEHRSGYGDYLDHAACRDDFCYQDHIKFIEHPNVINLVKVTAMLYESSCRFVSPDKIVSNVCSSAFHGRIEWSTNSPFSGHKFPWTEARINVYSSSQSRGENEIMAVADSWPNLETIHFDFFPANMDEDFILKFKTLLASGCWSKLRHVRFTRIISSAFRQVILSTIGSQLESLEFNYCTDIDMKEVLLCCKLESLIIDSRCKLLMEPGSPPIDCGPPSSFLPCLKKLQSAICLGQFSCLFESERPLLNDVNLCCLHFGIARTTESVGWKDLPKMWPNLEVLNVVSTGLSLPNLLNLAPQFKSLKRIRIKKDEPIHHNVPALPLSAEEIRNSATLKDFRLKNPNIQIVFIYHI